MISKITPLHINQGTIVLMIFDPWILMEVFQLFHLFGKLNNSKTDTLHLDFFIPTLLADALLYNYPSLFKEGQIRTIIF